MQTAGKSTMKTVIFANFSKTWGGGEKWHLLSARALRQRQYQVEILARSQGALAQAAGEQSIPCRTLSVSNLYAVNPFVWLQLVNCMRQIKPSAVILNGSKELKTVGIISKVMGIPQIIYRRGIPQPIRLTWLNRWLFRHVVTRILVNSQITCQSLQELVRVTDQQPPIVIYNGLDISENQHSRPESRTIAVVARLSYEKGVDLAIQALSRIKQKIPDVRMRIIGDGPEHRHLERLVADLHLQAQVEFNGFAGNVADLLHDCALLLMPSRWEGFGHVLLEAMHLKMPCVAFRNTSADEIITDGITGYLAEPENIEQLAEKVIDLFLHPDRISKMGKAGYDRLAAHFSLQKATDQLEEALCSLTN